MVSANERTRFTASVRANLVRLVDEKAEKLHLTRSDVVEQAMEIWLRSQVDAEEEEYFERSASEMNADAKDWNRLTSNSRTAIGDNPDI